MNEIVFRTWRNAESTPRDVVRERPDRTRIWLVDFAVLGVLSLLYLFDELVNYM